MLSSFVPKGVCSTRIDFELDEEGLVHKIRFTNGCPGNSAGLAKLAENRPATELIKELGGIQCGRKDTSCPDQFAQALKQKLQI